MDYFMQLLRVSSIIFGVINLCSSQIVYDLHFKYPEWAALGYAMPRDITMVAGNEAHIKMTRDLINMENCTITSPTGAVFLHTNAPDSRYEAIENSCGIKIKNIQTSDAGRWRLAAKRTGKSIIGISTVHVIDEPQHTQRNTLTLEDGSTDATLDFSDENYYCSVRKPFATDTSLILGPCNVEIEKVNKALDGVWQVEIATPGVVAEIENHPHISVLAERLDVGYTLSNNKLNMHCNLLSSNKTVKFCRFQTTSQSAKGYNLVDGISDGVHSYYGKGFYNRECGMTIDNPSSDDIRPWRCTLGLAHHEGNEEKLSTMLGLINVRPVDDFRAQIKSEALQSNEVKKMYAVSGREMTLECLVLVPLTYCWFQHPNGSQYTPGEKQSHSDLFWYSGSGLNVGECKITFKAASQEDAGIWKCHVGLQDHIGEDHTESLEVKVSGPIVALEKEVYARVGDNRIIDCKAVGELTLLAYCRFFTPSLNGFSLDEGVTHDLAVDGSYFFPQNRSMAYGDCSIDIKHVRDSDFGVWTCAALIISEMQEYSDTFTLQHGEAPSGSTESQTISGEKRSAASIAGLSFGLTLFVVLVALGVYRSVKARTAKRESTAPIIHMSELSPRISNGSEHSNSSRESVRNDNVVWTLN